MPDAELIRLINAASTELLRRAGQKVASPAPCKTLQPDPAVAALISKPDPADEDFCLMIAARIRSGGYVKAGERERVAAIAQNYPLWVERQGLPTAHNAGDWRRGAAHASAPRARGR